MIYFIGKEKRPWPVVGENKMNERTIEQFYLNVQFPNATHGRVVDAAAQK